MAKSNAFLLNCYVIAGLFDVLEGMSSIVSDDVGSDISVQYCCQKCKRPLDLASDFGNFRTSDLSSAVGYEYNSGSSSPTYSPTSSLDHRLQVNAYLSDIINGRAETDHPMCQECADTLISTQQQLLDFQKEEIVCLESLLEQLKANTTERSGVSTNVTHTAEQMFSISQRSRQTSSLSATNSPNEDSPNPLETSSFEVDEDGSFREPLYATGDSPAEAEEGNVTTKAELHCTQEELVSLRQEFVRLQHQSRLLDKQIATNEAALLVRQAELDRITNEYNEQRLTLMQAEESLGVLDARLNDARYQYERLRRTNVLNAAFPIWYDGHIGVINGLHLGRLASKPITWPEINGALGQCAMLVTCLAKKLSYTFKNYVIIPMGSQSKIAALPNGTPLPLYNSPGSMRLFSSASFDNALVMLLDCVGQLQARVERPPFFHLPFKILDGGRIEDRNGSVFSIKCSTTTDENWTKALKMLLMDLKYLIAATVGRPDRSTSKAQAGH
ncbi:Beclin-1 [Echinococcus granulosus]|nr:Beclin-1 [Echinococcus granulosus]